MRKFVLLVGTSMLCACGGGGGGIQSSGSGIATTTTSNHSFANPTEEKTYQAIGASHSFTYTTEKDNLANTVKGQAAQLYAGNSSTVRNSPYTIKYNPRDAIFDITIADTNARVDINSRFQDPAHRTNFGGLVEPQTGVPQLSLAGIQYLQSGSATSGLINNTLDLSVTALAPSASYDVTTFFYQKPGTTTKYVTFAGFLRNSISANRVDTPAVAAVAPSPGNPGSPAVAAKSITTSSYNLIRGALVFGETTLSANVPKNGTGSFAGDMLATAVFNNQIDTAGADAPTYFQWIDGTATAQVDFGKNIFSLNLDGKTFAPQYDGNTNGNHTIESGAIFGARGNGRIDLVAAGGFLGQFQTAWFINPDTTRYDLLIAGSSFDGAFYGPKGTEIGGSYRIVGGTPDERIDVLGVFTGK